MKTTTPSCGGPLLRAFALVSLLLALGLPIAHAQDETPAPEAPAQPDRVTSPSNPRPGVYYLDYGTYRWDPAKYPVDGSMRVYGWSWLNPSSGGYNWTDLDNWIADRKALGLGTGIMTTTYDGSDAGDIRSTPDYVIKMADTVLPATYKNSSTDANYPNQPHYVNYWKRADYNADFGNSNHEYLWYKSGNVSVVDGPDSGTNYAAKLGGVNNASGSIYHLEERVPAMPSILDGTKRVYVTANVYIDTADSGANDHLYMEVWDTNNQKLGGTQVDITNLAHASGSWKTYEFDVSNFGTERKLRAAFRVTTNGSNVTTYYVDNVTLTVRHLIPKYHSEAYFNAYKTFIDSLGARYKNNPDLQFVSFGTGIYGENQPVQQGGYPNFNFMHVVQGSGLTSASWTDYINRVTQAHLDAFTVVPGQPPQRSLLVQAAPIYLSVQEREDTTDYAGSRKVGISENFLSPDWTQAFKNDGTGFYDSYAKYQGQAPFAFEGYDSDLCNPVLSYWGVMQALDKKVDYLRADTPLFRNWDGTVTPDAPALDWAGNYLGKTPETTPKVWAIMREHRNPTLTTCRGGGAYYLPSGGGTIWPDLGNYDFYLKQVDSIAGGKTVAETNDKGVDSRYARDPANLNNAAPNAGLGNCPTTLSYRSDLFGASYPCFSQPYNPDLPLLEGQDPNDTSTWYNNLKLPNWTGNGKEAYTVRRTDQATNNPYMFFLIDNGYIPGSDTYGAIITVKYFDIGTDTWSLKYDSAAGEKTAGTVTKTGSKTLKTAAFTVADGRFGGQLTGGADFYIDSRNGTTNDGNEWIHMVEVERTTALTAPKAPVASAAARGADVQLTWAAVTQDVNGKSAVVDHYDVWRSATSPYFAPNAVTDTPLANVFEPSFTDVGALSAAGSYYYVVTAVNAAPSALSNRTGKFSFGLTR